MRRTNSTGTRRTVLQLFYANNNIRIVPTLNESEIEVKWKMENAHRK